MDTPRSRRCSHSCPSPVLLLVLLLAGWTPLGGQELPLKMESPETEAVSCPEFSPGQEPTEEELAQARQLGSEADEALLLGDRERARDLLARAVELDPTEGILAYRYARILDDLGDRSGAQVQFCRVLELDPGFDERAYAEGRLLALSATGRPRIPEEARAEFRVGLSRAAAGRLAEAIEGFGIAFRLAPDWAEAVYNRGVLQHRLGADEAAISDLRRYLELRPDAEDALIVAEWLGQLQVSREAPSPGAALGLGLLMPGLGQFHSGRTLAGVIPAFAAAAAVSFGVLYTEPKEGETWRPYKYHGAAVAAGITVIAAIEAYIWARNENERRSGRGLARIDLGPATLDGPALSARGARVDLSFLRVTF